MTQVNYDCDRNAAEISVMANLFQHLLVYNPGFPDIHQQLPHAHRQGRQSGMHADTFHATGPYR